MISEIKSKQALNCIENAIGKNLQIIREYNKLTDSGKQKLLNEQFQDLERAKFALNNLIKRLEQL